MTDATAGTALRRTLQPSSKVTAATSGSAVGMALAQIGLWLLSTYGKVQIPEDIRTCVLIVSTAGLTYLAGWLARPSVNEMVAADHKGRSVTARAL